MSEQEWGKHALLDPTLAQRVVPDQVKLEPPLDIDAARAVSPPVPDQPHAHSPLDIPQQAELWRQINAGDVARDTASADQPPDDASAAAQLSMALYLLQMLHAQGKPGFGHLRCDDRKHPGDDEEEDPDAVRRE